MVWVVVLKDAGLRQTDSERMGLRTELTSFPTGPREETDHQLEIRHTLAHSTLCFFFIIKG